MTVLVAETPPVAPFSAGTEVVGMGEWRLAGGSAALRCAGLGSCVAIIVFAPAQQLVALAHCMLPHRLDDDAELSKYVDTAVPQMLTALAQAGASAPFTATLVGGASMFPGLPDGVARDIGRDNVAAARAMLTSSSIPVRSEDVGGHIGRSVLVHPATQRVVVHTIRDGERCL